MRHHTSALAGLGPDDGSQRAQVLIVGSGGREHALAWKISQSTHVARVFVAPGNGGTQHRHEHDRVHNVQISPNDHDGLINFARLEDIALTVVGPEAPLAEGLVDRFSAEGLKCFGPRRVSAQLEASKVFAKNFMERHGIPTAASKLFESLEPAKDYVRELDGPCVVKASGLAAGKGVAVCDTAEEAVAALDQIMGQRAFGEAGAAVLIEERLIGEEASVLAFCDGHIAVAMPAAQDHKRLRDGDLGPNTGGMGAYAPAPVMTPELSAFVQTQVFDKVMAGMEKEAYPYVGILYAGLMITKDGPRVLEFNCRFGDPETQVLLPMLDCDLYEIIAACVAGDLAPGMVQWRKGAAATVVAASGGYPIPKDGETIPKGLPIGGIELADHARDTMVFHAGTQLAADGWQTSGGRVLAVSGVGGDLHQALDRAYAGIHRIGFDGMQVREDIGWRALARLPRPAPPPAPIPLVSSSYKSAGVDLAAGARAVALMKDAVEETNGPAVL
ncbi:MAG: phosphoribosylamine--glycine ligase, partial [Myxococcales bacterium]|nr:phosphoribosylamine--glycine ligase [Myxococcales bacterium]